jgi:hypothetical protein
VPNNTVTPEDLMAHHPTDPHPAPVLESGMDYEAHEGTYNGFVRGVKWVTIGLAIFMVVLYFLINP